MTGYFLIIIILFLPVALYLFLNKNPNYWKVRGVPYISPIPILGNLAPLFFFKRSPGQFTGDIYNASEGKDHRYVGFFLFNNEPALILRDPELIKSVLVKDFQHFSSRSLMCSEKCDPVGANSLFLLRGPKWKYVRSQLSPGFTSAKFKQMFHLVKETGRCLLQFIEKSMENRKEKLSAGLEVKSILTRYMIDVISIGSFGLKTNTIQNSDSPFSYFGDKIFDMTIKRSFEVRSFFFMHWFVKTFKFYFFQKESTEFFRNVFCETLREREEKKIVRSDFVDILINLKNEPKQTLESLTEDGVEETIEFKGDLMLAQPVFFFTAGFETTSTTISWALYELALQPHLQNRLRKEIQSHIAENGGELTYEGIFEMKYLEMVVSETLRKYPPMPFIDRVCTKEYQIPDSDVIIQEGTPVFVPLFEGLHWDEKFFPSPEKFDPERFNDENKNSFHPFSYLPFGEGPHLCIGRRFGFLNVKTAICFVIKEFRVEVCEETKIPLEIDNRSFVIAAKNGNNLKFVKI